MIPPTKKSKRSQPERQERLAFMDWVRLNPNIEKRLIAIENGGSRNFLEAVNLKRIGLKAGTPDYFLLLPSNDWHGLFLEFKAGKNKLTTSQKAFFKNAENLGYKCSAAWSWSEAVDIINKYKNNNE